MAFVRYVALFVRIIRSNRIQLLYVIGGSNEKGFVEVPNHVDIISEVTLTENRGRRASLGGENFCGYVSRLYLREVVGIANCISAATEGGRTAGEAAIACTTGWGGGPHF